MAVYCEESDVVLKAGQEAVDLRRDDPGASDSLDASIEEASSWIDFYLIQRYPDTSFADNRWVKYACVTLTLYFYCQRRLESVPSSIEAQYKRLIEVLGKILSGASGYKVPGLAERKVSAPVLSQPRVILWPYPRVVTQRQQSTGRPEGYPQRNDPTEPPPLT